MPPVRLDGDAVAKHLFVDKPLFRHGQESALAIEEGDRILREQLKLTVEVLVEKYGTKERFQSAAGPWYESDLDGYEICAGVEDRFDEIEKEKSNGFDWLHRKLELSI